MTVDRFSRLLKVSIFDVEIGRIGGEDGGGGWEGGWVGRRGGGGGETKAEETVRFIKFDL